MTSETLPPVAPLEPTTPSRVRVRYPGVCLRCGGGTSRTYTKRCRPCSLSVEVRSRKKPASMETLFWRHVPETGDGCWLWHGPMTTTGYGHLRVGGRGGQHITSNRAAWTVLVGPIPTGLWVLHHCDVKLCVNPAHLYLGTHADNVRDVQARIRRKSERLYPEAVRAIRADREAGVPALVLQRRYGVSASTISLVFVRKVWRHVA